MITVAITVYNRAKYITECLESVMNQTYSDMEILCVDDVSTDGSYEILQQYAAKDSRIRLFRNEKNSGVQVSRNLAINEARGEYITFVDDDDWISLDCLEHCMREFRDNPEVDCITLAEKRVEPDGTMYDPEGRMVFDKISGEQAFRWSMPWHIGGCYVCRTEFQRRFPFDNSCRNFGDENTGRMLLLHSRSVLLSKGIYYYRMLDDSVSHKLSMAQFTRLTSQHSMCVELKKEGIKTELLEIYEEFRWLNIINAYVYYAEHRKELNGRQKAEALELIRNARETMDLALMKSGMVKKFGYMPLLCPCLPAGFSWNLFRIQEESYYYLRRMYYSLSGKSL